MSSTTEMRQTLQIPTLKSRRDVFVLTKVFDVLHGNIQSLEHTKMELHNPDRNLRSKFKLNLKIPKTNKTNFGKKSFNYIGPTKWNQLPIGVKSMGKNSRN